MSRTWVLWIVLAACAPQRGDDDAGDDDAGDDDAGDDDAGDDDAGDDDTPPSACPTALVAAALDCVAGWGAEPGDGTWLIDRVLACADAEPLAAAWDALCGATPQDPICEVDPERFFAEIVPSCQVATRQAAFAQVCALPEQERDVGLAPGFTELARRWIDASTPLRPEEEAAILATSADTGWPVDSVEAALAATDDGGFHQHTVLQYGSGRVLVGYATWYGDTRVGTWFFRDTTFPVARVSDGYFTDCAIEVLPQGQPCAEGGPTCAPGLACRGEHGELGLPGVCADVAVDGEDEVCVDHRDCGAGLFCAPLGAGAVDGVCRPGWMRRTFSVDETMLVAGESLALSIPVSGLASVPTMAALELTIGQSGPNALIVDLINPLGTETAVRDTRPDPQPDLAIDGELLAVPGDEPVNGIWTLRVQDAAGAAAGGVWRLRLRLDSRWD